VRSRGRGSGSCAREELSLDGGEDEGGKRTQIPCASRRVVRTCHRDAERVRGYVRPGRRSGAVATTRRGSARGSCAPHFGERLREGQLTCLIVYT